jgi:hypothetical protein
MFFPEEVLGEYTNNELVWIEIHISKRRGFIVSGN